MSERFEFGADKLKMLVYGQPGAGKTTFVATAMDDERLAPALILDAFGNPTVLRKREVKPDIVTIERMEDFNSPYEWLTEGQDPKHPFAVKYKLNPPYKTLIVDGLTEVQRFVIRTISGVNYTPPGNLTPALTRQGFGQVLGTMLNWAVSYLTIDMNIIITSLEAEKSEGGAGSLVRRSPLIWGQSGGEVAGYALLVPRLSPRLATPPAIRAELQDDSYNVAFFMETQQHYAKDQYGLGIEWMEAPTLPKIMDLIEQSA